MKHFVLLMICMAFSLPAMQVNAQEMEFTPNQESLYSYLEGNYKGEFQYLEYYDDSTVVSVKATMSFTRTLDGLDVFQFYVEPDGNLFRDNATLSLSPDSKTLYLDGEWAITRFDEENDNLRILAEQDSYDNDREATIQLELMVQKDVKLALIRHISYKDGRMPEGPIIRDAYYLDKAQ